MSHMIGLICPVCQTPLRSRHQSCEQLAAIRKFTAADLYAAQQVAAAAAFRAAAGLIKNDPRYDHKNPEHHARIRLIRRKIADDLVTSAKEALNNPRVVRDMLAVFTGSQDTIEDVQLGGSRGDNEAGNTDRGPGEGSGRSSTPSNDPITGPPDLVRDAGRSRGGEADTTEDPGVGRPDQG